MAHAASLESIAEELFIYLFNIANV